MDAVTDVVGLVLVAVGAFGAGFEFRMIRGRLRLRILAPGARLFRMYVTFIVCGLVFVSDHWNSPAVVWIFTSLGVALVITQGVLMMRSRVRAN
jgi:hypothetical protein